MKKEEFVSYIREKANQHWPDLIILACLLGAFIGLSNTDPWPRTIYERDPNLSYYVPHDKDTHYHEETVSTTIAALLLLIPLLVLLVILMIVFFVCGPKLKALRVPRDNYDWILFIFAAGESIVMNYVATEFLKVYIGRPRPAFFDLCNYQHYHAAFYSATNQTNYETKTKPNTPISTKIEDLIGNGTGPCFNYEVEKNWNTTDTGAWRKEVRDSLVSFPSAHTSSIFASVVITGLVALALVNRITPRFNLIKGLVFFAFLIGAASIAGTRSRDSMHHFDDILGGIIVGTGSAFVAYLVNYSNVFKGEKKDNKSDKQSDNKSDKKKGDKKEVEMKTPPV